MNSNQATYSVEFVFCIDATGSMNHVLNLVKDKTKDFFQDILKDMTERNKIVDTLRIKFIIFRDIYADEKDAILESPFFDVRDGQSSYRSFLENIQASGGGDEPESGLEALTLAIKSDWSSQGEFQRKRQVIVLWTDASAHPLEKIGQYDLGEAMSSFPKNLNELTDLWEGVTLSRTAKRLVLFAPDCYPWSEIANNWENVVQFPSQAGDGLANLEYREIINIVSGSV